MSQVFDKGGNVIPVTLIKLSKEEKDISGLIDAPVTITGVSKGKGFAGVMKRWGFAGQQATHGQSDRQRAPGSIGGTTTPGRVFPGKKMPGRLGGDKVTIKGLRIIEADEKEKVIKVTGAIPGARNGKLEIKLEDRS